MAAPSSPSFIPKQPAKGKVKRRSTRKVYVLTYVSFVTFFGTLIAAGGIFFYELSVKSQLELEKQNLVEERQRFNQADFERVKEFDRKLESAKKLLNNHVSVLSVFESFEAATVAEIQLTALVFDRSSNRNINMAVNAITDNFNSVIFQRDIYKNNPILEGAVMRDFLVAKTSPEEVELGFPERTVTFSLLKNLRPGDIQYEPRDLDEILSGQTEEEVIVTESTEGGETAGADEEVVLDPINNTTQ